MLKTRNLILAALLIWAVRALLPALGLPPPIARVLEVVVIVLVVLWLLTALLGVGPFPVVRLR